MEKKKIISIEERIPKLKAARKKKANRRLLFYLFLFFILITIIVYLQSPLSNVDEVKVNGNNNVDEAEIINMSEITEDTNIWTINSKQVQEVILTHPIIKSVKMKRKLPRTVMMDVEEHKVLGFLEEENDFTPILDNGEVIKKINNIDVSEAPLLKNFSEKEFLKRMLTELDDTPMEIFDLISEIVWEPTKQNKYKIKLYMTDGFIVQTSIRNFAKKINSYPSVVTEIEDGDKGIIHMGVGTYFEKIEDK